MVWQTVNSRSWVRIPARADFNVWDSHPRPAACSTAAKPTELLKHSTANRSKYCKRRFFSIFTMVFEGCIVVFVPEESLRLKKINHRFVECSFYQHCENVSENEGGDWKVLRRESQKKWASFFFLKSLEYCYWNSIKKTKILFWCTVKLSVNRYLNKWKRAGMKNRCHPTHLQTSFQYLFPCSFLYFHFFNLKTLKCYIEVHPH